MTAVAALLLPILAIVIALLAVGGGNAPRRRGVAAAALALAVAAMLVGLGGMAHSAVWLSVRLPEGVLAWGVGSWSGFWVLAATVLASMTGLILWVERHPVGTFAAWAWTLTAAVAFLAARSPLALVVAWGFLALAVYGIVVSGTSSKSVLHAAWVMVVMNEMGAACLLVGAIMLEVFPAMGPTTLGITALLGVAGLGAKAGLFPFQLWMPVAEPEAPGAVAGLLSGTVTMVTMLGIWRWISWLSPRVDEVGWIIVVLGLAGALLAMMHAIVDRDYKRVLAYSSAEWMGIAFVLLGLTLVFRQAGLGAAAGLTEDGFFMLLLMHAAAKLTAFIIAEWVERASGTRSLNDLGGVLKQRPWLGGLVALPLLALMAVPPTGGYLAEWMLAQSTFMGAAGALRVPLIIVVAAAAFVLAGGATAMLRWYATLFLGPPRRTLAAPSPIYIALAAVGAVIAWATGLAVGWWSPWIGQWAPRLAGFRPPLLLAPSFTNHPGASAILVPLGARIFSELPNTPGMILFPGPAFTVTSPWDLFWFGGALIALLFGLRAWGFRRRATGAVRVVSPWTGGEPYQLEDAWSASGVAHPLRLAFAPVIRLRRTRTVESTHVAVQMDAVDRLLEEGFNPLLSAARRGARVVQSMEDGQLSHYVGYVTGALLATLVVLRLTGVL